MQQPSEASPSSSTEQNSVGLVVGERRSILDFSFSEAKDFFLKEESYYNSGLPPYIKFNRLLQEIDKKFNEENLTSFCKDGAKPYENDDINYTILHNKDGKYAWRPMELIHPVLYVTLVRDITTKKHWETIITRFQEFSRNSKIQCTSYPVESKKQKDRAEQILQWWENLEQRSIELALDYEHLIQTDITDCYGSIYTHSIPWALHGKGEMKKKENRNSDSFIGNLIDKHIRRFSNSQTNGIPQGSVLMDFIAEMVLGYADLLLAKKIEALEIQDYQILRYRDDYRVFCE